MDRTNPEFAEMAETLYPGQQLSTDEQVTSVIQAMKRGTPCECHNDGKGHIVQCNYCRTRNHRHVFSKQSGCCLTCSAGDLR